jgi:DNA-3-methyladenine glycosylase I
VDAWAARTITVGADGVARCAWGVEGDPLYRAYHDEEWGRPSRDERHLFEMLILEGAQAGLSWSTILRKREGYRRAFAGFDPAVVAAFDDPAVARLLGDAGIVRNRLKVESAVANARAVLALREAGEGLADLLWGFVGGAPLDARRANLGSIPAETAESRTMSRELKRRGFRFVGPTVCYAFMQATGMVNDHVVGCAAGDEIRAPG